MEHLPKLLSLLALQVYLDSVLLLLCHYVLVCFRHYKRRLSTYILSYDKEMVSLKQMMLLFFQSSHNYCHE